MLNLVTENRLDEWVRGNARDAQGIIVELVWRLVAASCPNPRDRRFPLSDSISQHGPDGILDTANGFDPFVPEGHSVWEIGTDLRSRDKATSDYNDLTKAVPENIRRETTFIFVTPLSGRRVWQYTWKEGAQATWLEKRRNRGEWKGVRVIDGTKLIDWVNQFPAIELWLAQRIDGLKIQQIETPEQHWNILRSIGAPPPLTPDVFLANRDDACAKLKEVLDDTVVQLKLTTHYPDQVTDFVAAYLASLSAESNIEAAARCLIISGTDAWNTVCTYRTKHILIADTALDLNGDAGTRLIQTARKAGHAAVFGGSRGGIPDPTSVALQTPSVHQVREALTKAGYSEERARTVAHKSDGNLGSLLRCLQNLSLLPEWAEKTDAAELAIAAILGSWSDKSAADRAVIEHLSGNSYGEWIGTMREIALRSGPPLNQQDGNWKFIARYEGWYTLGPRLFDEHLDRLLDVAVSVLGENDPQFDLPTEERYAARVYGKVLSHSNLLRTGLAESLALLGSHPKALTSCTFGKAEYTAVLAVREILADADWLRWASLNDLLPLLAEAAPREFLNAVAKALRSNPCPFDELFAQERGEVSGRTYMSGLLWALETLAWDADYLNGAVICLGELAARDPGGHWTNRPSNSLTTILLPWLPQTCAPIAKRVAAVKVLLAELPDVGWELLLTLLPRYHSASLGTRRPAWRATISGDWQERVTPQAYWEQVSAYSELAITEAKKDVSRLAVLINHLESLPQPAHEQLLEYLASDAVMAIPEADRLRLWTNLAGLVAKHRKFTDAEWAMTPEQVERMASIAERMSPTAYLLRHQRLFSERDMDLYEKKSNYGEQSRELENCRQRAIEEVATEGGTEAVLEFAQTVESPWRVGIAFGSVADTDAVVLPTLLESDQKSLAQFAGGFVWSRFRSRGWQWVDSIETSQWNSTQIGQFLSFLPFTQDTWERSKRLLGRDESAYWTKTAANPYQAEGEFGLAIDRLLLYGRPHAAIRCFYKMLHDKKPFDSAMAVRALLQALQSPESPRSMDGYEIVEIIKALQDNPDTNAADLFHVEWAYLPLLDKQNDASPKLIEYKLSNEPEFFCEMIRLVFRSKNEEYPLGELTEARENIATNAYRLLDAWRTPPGCREGGTYNGEALAQWLESVKKQCEDTGHLELAMTMVGHVLIHVPPDPDGLWIHHSAAAVLNAKDAGDMRDGFRSALFSSRGVYYVDPTGKPERELAAQYRTQAEAVETTGYHRLATTLRELADTYEQEAERLSSKESFNN